MRRALCLRVEYRARVDTGRRHTGWRDTGRSEHDEAAKSSIDALDYAVSCSKDSECGTIYEGDACQACRCPNAAIQAQALEQYRRDLMRFDSCHQPERCGADCAASIGEPAQCRQGRCTWVPPG